MHKVPARNVTLSLPEPLLKKLKIFAAQKNRSMSSIMAEAVQKLMANDGEAERDWKWLKSQFGTLDLTVDGKIPWTREDLYDRGVR